MWAVFPVSCFPCVLISECHGWSKWSLSVNIAGVAAWTLLNLSVYESCFYCRLVSVKSVNESHLCFSWNSWVTAWTKWSSLWWVERLWVFLMITVTTSFAVCTTLSQDTQAAMWKRRSSEWYISGAMLCSQAYTYYFSSPATAMTDVCKVLHVNSTVPSTQQLCTVCIKSKKQEEKKESKKKHKTHLRMEKERKTSRQH